MQPEAEGQRGRAAHLGDRGRVWVRGLEGPAQHHRHLLHGEHPGQEGLAPQGQPRAADHGTDVLLAPLLQLRLRGGALGGALAVAGRAAVLLLLLLALPHLFVLILAGGCSRGFEVRGVGRLSLAFLLPLPSACHTTRTLLSVAPDQIKTGGECRGSQKRSRVESLIEFACAAAQQRSSTNACATELHAACSRRRLSQPGGATRTDVLHQHSMKAPTRACALPVARISPCCASTSRNSDVRAPSRRRA